MMIALGFQGVGVCEVVSGLGCGMWQLWPEGGCSSSFCSGEGGAVWTLGSSVTSTALTKTVGIPGDKNCGCLWWHCRSVPGCMMG